MAGDARMASPEIETSDFLDLLLMGGPDLWTWRGAWAWPRDTRAGPPDGVGKFWGWNDRRRHPGGHGSARAGEVDACSRRSPPRREHAPHSFTPSRLRDQGRFRERPASRATLSLIIVRGKARSSHRAIHRVEEEEHTSGIDFPRR